MMQSVIQNTIIFVKDQLKNAEAGHNWSHIERVWKLSKKIAQVEGGNLNIIQLSVLLHDVADPKFHNGDENLALEISKNFLHTQEISEEEIQQILFIIKYISFKNKGELQGENPPLELQIVQDADRLDAIGAIGIARTFHFGGFKNNPIYDPDIKPNLAMSKEEYKKSNGTTINHFYEKLLLLKDMMNTDIGKKLAEERHQFMLLFLREFEREINIL